MSKVESVLLLTDTASALKGFDSDSFPNIRVKPSEVRWNDMQMEDSIDAIDRLLFSDNAEVNERTSGVVADTRWKWGDSIADASVDYDSVFLFAPHEDIFQQQMAEVVNAQVLQKTHYSAFFKQHGRQTGKLKSFVIKTNNWFAGIGLTVWQCHQLLNKTNSGQPLPLAHLKKYFEQLSSRTHSIAVIPCHQLHPWTRNLLVDESMLSKMRGNLGRTKWISIGLSQRTPEVSERDSMEAQLEIQLQKIITVISQKKLSFSRIIFSCSNLQMSALKKHPAFLQLDKMQVPYKFKWLHQPAPILAQVLTGKDPIHISYSAK